MPQNLATFVGISLVILSCGLSIAIAKTNSLSFGEGSKMLILNREINEMESQASSLLKLSTQLQQEQKLDNHQKQELLKLEEKIGSTKEDLVELLE